MPMIQLQMIDDNLKISSNNPDDITASSSLCLRIVTILKSHSSFRLVCSPFMKHPLNKLIPHPGVKQGMPGVGLFVLDETSLGAHCYRDGGPTLYSMFIQYSVATFEQTALVFLVTRYDLIYGIIIFDSATRSLYELEVERISLIRFSPPAEFELTYSPHSTIYG
ncbi:hypothetical protein AX14_006642 [Amanita brunnescens Koide BX004]|nr:hypothetical protein AX14_006642 [Amanita brunnescens Koide BX004]